MSDIRTGIFYHDDIVTMTMLLIGTPSLAEPETIYKVIETVKDTVDLPADVEVTIEVNPSSTEAAKLG